MSATNPKLSAAASKGARARWAKASPEQRQEWARRAAAGRYRTEETMEEARRVVRTLRRMLRHAAELLSRERRLRAAYQEQAEAGEVALLAAEQLRQFNAQLKEKLAARTTTVSEEAHAQPLCTDCRRLHAPEDYRSASLVCPRCGQHLCRRCWDAHLPHCPQVTREREERQRLAAIGRRNADKKPGPKRKRSCGECWAFGQAAGDCVSNRPTQPACEDFSERSGR